MNCVVCVLRVLIKTIYKYTTIGDSDVIPMMVQMMQQQANMMEAMQKRTGELMKIILTKIDNSSELNEGCRDNTKLTSQVVPFRRFERNQESWTNYHRQLQAYFSSTGVIEEAQKYASRLSWLVPATFDIISKAAKLDVENLSYTQIVAIFDSHYNEKVHEITARFRFINTRKKDGQSYRQWINDSEGAANDCNFHKREIVTGVKSFMSGYGT